LNGFTVILFPKKNSYENLNEYCSESLIIRPQKKEVQRLKSKKRRRRYCRERKGDYGDKKRKARKKQKKDNK
jgi:hypothetical protein